jgi:hypothetical protein
VTRITGGAVQGKGSFANENEADSLEVGVNVPISFKPSLREKPLCRDASGHICRKGKVGATRWPLDAWIKTLPQPWTVTMEATIFTGWIYDHLKPHAEAVKVAHSLMLRAIAAAKKKNDRIDAGKIADCVRCGFLPECYMAATAQEIAVILSVASDQSVGKTWSLRILFCRVVRFKPRRSAAPFVPAILPEAAFRALMMACRSAS